MALQAFDQLTAALDLDVAREAGASAVGETWEDTPGDVLDTMVTLPPTQNIRDIVERIERTHAEELASGRKSKKKMAAVDARWLASCRRQLALCEARDRFQEARRGMGDAYADCWCLGRGGKYRIALAVRYGPPGDEQAFVGATSIVETKDGPRDAPQWGWSNVCSCPDGLAAEAYKLETRAAMFEAIERNARLRRAGMAKIPAIYDGLTLTTWMTRAIEKGATTNEVATVSHILRAWKEDAERPVVAGEMVPRTLILAGAYGAGKTGLAASIAQRYLEAAKTVIYRAMGATCDELRAAWRSREEGAEAKLIQQYAEADLVVIDDLGSEALTDVKELYLADLLYRILDARVTAGLPTIVTVNSDSAALTRRVGERVMERLLPDGISHKLVMSTPNLREDRGAPSF